MSDETEKKPLTLYSALAAAQAEMGRAAKDSTNPHFKSKYADLASVMDACMPHLSKYGIAVIQPPEDFEDGRRYCKTILVHGATGDSVECRVPLIIGKNDMQGYGSAVTYARRYGLMAMAGIAPDDDDGNAAALAAPKPATSAEMKRSLESIERDLVDVKSRVTLTGLWHIVAKRMNDENWPMQTDENSFRQKAIDMFADKKAALIEAEEAEQAENEEGESDE